MIKKQYEEAIKRIEKLNFIENAINDFEQGILNKSERAVLPGILYWLDDEEKEFIKRWQKETGNFAYHVIKDNTEMGTMYSILYVSKYEEEWNQDIKDLENELAIAYCGIGLDEMYFEYGSIGVRPANGGLQRIW